MKSSLKKIPWWEPRIGSEPEREFINDVLKANYANEGRLTSQFEEEVARLLRVKYAVATTSGTSAIFLALKALGVGHGDEVIVPDATFIATANAVVLCGATPVLVDIHPTTLTIDVEAMEKAITPKTKAIVPVHVTGRPADMERILSVAKRHGLYVVEDAAEAFFSLHHGEYLGTWGDAGCFSFSAAKTITTGQGGMIVTNSDAVYATLKPLKDQGRPVRGTGGDDMHETIGFNFKFTDIQAALGLGQLRLLTDRVDRMRSIYTLYRHTLQDIPQFSFFDIDIKGGTVPQWTDILTQQRKELDEYLRKQNIDTRRYWHPIHRQRPYWLPDDKFSQSTRLLPQALWLPSAFTLSDEDVMLVAQHIRNFFLRH